MTPMAFVVVPAVLGGLAGAGLVFVLARRHVSTVYAVLASVVTGAGFAAGWYLTTWVAAAGALTGIVVYAVARIWLRGGRALLAGVGSFLLFTIGAGAMLYAALDAMG
jgi:hypothetical protein